ncbi:MAG: hypothetical protein RIQ98_1188, partial [Bacteroidota bacterium]
ISGLFTYVELEGFEPSSKPRNRKLSTRLDLINFRWPTGSDQTLLSLAAEFGRGGTMAIG